MKPSTRGEKIKRGAWIVLTLAVCSSLEAWKVTVASTCGIPASLKYTMVREIHRSEPAFTQGLLYRNGQLFESAGGYGTSGFNRIDPETGQVEALGKLPQEQFGEGLETDGKTFFQLTWKEHRLNEWDANGALKQSISYPYEGWGLTRDPQGAWISSDGSSALYFFDHAPQVGATSWNSDSKITVMNENRSEVRLNELEYAQNAIFANIFKENRIVRIDPASGCVNGELDLSRLAASSGVDLAQNPEWVLNGIAYRPETGTFFITGKNWPTIYELKISSGGD